MLADQSHDYATVRGEREGDVCPTCGRLIDTDHQVMVLGPIARWTPRHADATRRDLMRAAVGLVDPGPGMPAVWIARLQHHAFEQGRNQK